MTNNSKTFDLVLNTVLDEDTSNLVIPINTVSLNSQARGMGIALEYVHFMNSVPCITVENNRVVLDTYLSGSFAQRDTIVLDAKQYSASTLASELSTKLTSISSVSSATVTYDNVTGKFSILFGVQASTTYRFVASAATAYQVLGVTQDDIGVFYSGDGTTTYTLSGLVDVSGPKLLVIECPELADYGTSRKETNFLKQIPLTSAYGTVQNYVSHALTFKHIRMQSLQSITLRLRDEHGRPFKLAKNTPFYMNVVMQPLHQ